MTFLHTNNRGVHAVILSGIFLVLGVLVYSGAYFFDAQKGDVIIPGVSIAGVSVQGLTKEEAYAKITEYITLYENKGVEFTALNHSYFLSAQPLESQTDATPLYDFDPDKAVDTAYAQGRGGSLFSRVIVQLQTRMNPLDLELPLDLQIEKMHNALSREFGPLVSAPQETKLEARNGMNNSLEVAVVPGNAGQELMIDAAILEAKNNLSRLSYGPVGVGTAYKEPKISTEEAKSKIPLFERAVSTPEINLTFASSTFRLTNREYAQWISLEKSKNDIALVLHPSEVQKSLETIAPNVEKEPKTARFEIDNGKIKSFAPDEKGVAIDYPAFLETLAATWRLSDGVQPLTSLAIPTKVLEPPISDNDVSKMGVKELIAVGRTNYKGSPANRRHNITLGIQKLNGSLVAPGAEFSTIGTLGDIDGVNGFKEELVIKGNETKPEFGGGLCQVSTTLFRSVLNAGLPVTARRNHSYRVSYYEPPVGKDATIYFPSPDFKWVNDTAHHILVLGRVEGDDAIFELWGTKDTRTQVQTDPKVFNIIPPPPKKEIPTTTLPVGKVRCTERPHAGATAVFNYTITYPNGEVKEQEFKSIYRPWGEVCLVGVDQATLDAASTTSGEVLTP